MKKMISTKKKDTKESQLDLIISEEELEEELSRLLKDFRSKGYFISGPNYPKLSDRVQIDLLAVIYLTQKRLNEYTKELIRTQNTLNRLTLVLIFLTVILAIFTLLSVF